MLGACPVALMVKSMFADPGDIKYAGPIPGSGRSPGGGHGNPLHPVFLPGESHGQRSLLAAVHGIPKSRTPLKWLNKHAPQLLTSRSQDWCPLWALLSWLVFASCFSRHSEPHNRTQDLSRLAHLADSQTPYPYRFCPLYLPYLGFRCLTEVTVIQGPVQCLEHSSCSACDIFLPSSLPHRGIL